MSARMELVCGHPDFPGWSCETFTEPYLTHEEIEFVSSLLRHNVVRTRIWCEGMYTLTKLVDNQLIDEWRISAARECFASKRQKLPMVQPQKKE